MPRIPAIVVLAVALLWSAGLASADVVYLKNGRKIRGRIVARSSAGLVLELPYGKMTIAERQIERVEKEDEDELLRRTGRELIDLDDTGRGLDYLRRAWQADPDAEGNRRALAEGLRTAVAAELERRSLNAADQLLAEAETVVPADTRIQGLRTRLDAERAELARRVQAARAALAAEHNLASHGMLRALMADYPEARGEWRRPLAESAAALASEALRAEQWSRASDLYHEALDHVPDLVEALRVPLTYVEIRTVIPLFEAGEHRAALPRLLRVHDLLPEDPAVMFYLALAHHGAGDLQEAGRLLRILAGPEGQKIDGPGHLAELQRLAEERLSREAGASVTAPTAHKAKDPRGTRETRHFVIHNQNRPLARDVERFLEHHLRRLRRTWFTGGAELDVDPRIVVHLYPDAETFAASAGAPPWSRGYTRVTRRLGLIRSVEIHLDGSAPQLLTSVVPHELAHALLPHRLGPSVAVPLWLTEGVATLEETSVKQRYFARVTAEAARAGMLMPLAQLLRSASYPADEGKVTQYYAQCNSFMAFLRQRLGPRRFFPSLRLLADGTDNETLRHATGFDTLARLERAWLRSLQDQ